MQHCQDNKRDKRALRTAVFRQVGKFGQEDARGEKASETHSSFLQTNRVSDPSLRTTIAERDVSQFRRQNDN